MDNRLVQPVRIITAQNRTRLTPDEHAELIKLTDLVTEHQTIGIGSRMFNNMLKHMDSRQWALIDTSTYGFDMGKGPTYPINCYRQSFMGWYMPES